MNYRLNYIDMLFFADMPCHNFVNKYDKQIQLKKYKTITVISRL